jgi:GT2 family glycosyltransferase
MLPFLIPTKDKSDLLSKCIESINKKTIGINYEIIILNNNSIEKQTCDLFDMLSIESKIKIINIYNEFNFSLLNNEGAKISKGNFICMLNNDIEVISGNWLEELVSLSSLKGIGAVGPTLLYPNDAIQHAGIILGINEWAGHSFKHSRRGNYGGIGVPLTIVREVSAVTGACLVVEKSKYFEVGGLNQIDLKVACNDVDFCLKLLKKGYRNLHTPNIELYHYESASRGEDSGEKRERFYKELKYMWDNWKEYLEDDPFYNINLTRKRENHSYNLE